MGKRRRRTRADRPVSDARAWPTHEHGTWTPMGEVEQYGNALRALRYTDRHRRPARILLAVIAAPVLVGVVLAVGLLVRDLLSDPDAGPEPVPPPPVTGLPPP